MTLQTFAILRVQAFCYRYPLSTPIVTSFGRMLNRPAVFVRVEDEDGQVGWGEVWANFPSTGAEHRARLVNEVLAPMMSGFAANGPLDVFDTLTKGTSVLVLRPAVVVRFHGVDPDAVQFGHAAAAIVILLPHHRR
jgi:D-galactarolactone cycloisomerase